MMRTKCFFFFMFFLTAIAVRAEVVWYNGKDKVSYSLQEHVSPVVKVALEMFSSDMMAVTGKRAERRSGAPIDIIQLDMLTNKEFKKFAKFHLPYENIITKKEAFYIGCHQHRLVVMGSDARGTAYGILELSRMAGVSPWIWWGDVVPERREKLSTEENFITIQWPSVEYRGIFINDEDWSLRPWAHEKMDTRLPVGAIGPCTYKKIFELLLRLRANTLWPAMHEGTIPFFKVKGNAEVADSCAIIIGSSHCEPMLCNNVGEWNSQQMGDYNYITNRQHVLDYWGHRVKETRDMEVLYTLGMRGIHDGSMEGLNTLVEKTTTLQQVIEDQRALLRKYHGEDLEQIPQVFIPYKEVLEIYENGLQLPDDVIMMWCDDNYGYLTRLPNEHLQRRSGGAGVYYHLSYWGRPHDYLWLTTTQPGLIAYEMQMAFNHHARKIWIANVHDPKVAAYDLNLFLDMAWNINSVTPQNVSRHLTQWLQTQFGKDVGQRIVPIMSDFYRLTALRKPEFMGWSQVELEKQRFPRGMSPATDSEFSATAFGNELERYLDDFEKLKVQITDVERHLRPEQADAFFAAVKYPVFAAAAMATKHLQAQEARHIARPSSFHHDEEALVSAARSLTAYRELQSLTYHYNKELAGGKWSGLMNMNPRDLPVFGEPLLPDKLTEEEIRDYSRAEIIDKQLTAMHTAQQQYRKQQQPPGVIAKNAYDYTAATDGITTIELLGHSMKAVHIPCEGSVSYQFTTSKHGEAILRMAFIPTHPVKQGDLRFSVSIDGTTPQVFSLKERLRSEQWKKNVLRGQVVCEMKHFFTWGKHTLTIKALDEHILLDQWMFDLDTERRFYSFPLPAAN